MAWYVILYIILGGVYMDILQLEYFCSAAEMENFTLAAKRHFIPQSAMSITIKRLEKELETQLFNRIGNRIQLNETGKRFYTHAKACLAEFYNAKECVQTTDEPCGEIRLLVLEERRTMAELVSQFKEKYPQIRFSVCHNLSEQPSFTYDIRVSSTVQTDDEYISAPILTEKLVLAVSKSHRFAHRQRVSMSELRDEAFIVQPPEYSINRLTMDSCQKNGFIPQISIICDDPFCIRKYIAANMGISFVPPASWEGLISDDIVLIPVDCGNLVRKTVLECSKASLSSAAVKLFFDYCISATSYLEKQRNGKSTQSNNELLQHS